MAFLCYVNAFKMSFSRKSYWTFRDNVLNATKVCLPTYNARPIFRVCPGTHITVIGPLRISLFSNITIFVKLKCVKQFFVQNSRNQIWYKSTIKKKLKKQAVYLVIYFKIKHSSINLKLSSKNVYKQKLEPSFTKNVYFTSWVPLKSYLVCFQLCRYCLDRIISFPV